MIPKVGDKVKARRGSFSWADIDPICVVQRVQPDGTIKVHSNVSSPFFTSTDWWTLFAYEYDIITRENKVGGEIL